MLDRDLIHVLLDARELHGRYRLRMIAAWPKVDPKQGRETQFKHWATIASVPPSVVKLLGPSLLEIGVCGPGGHVDPTAAAIVNALLVRSLEELSRHGARRGLTPGPEVPPQERGQ